ncbi:MAG: hypothetical protein VKL97_06180 [Cyanobacteriota bacterium]|nr:hypothetical protein [Cyanobacteriota bacterium]
MQRTVQRRSGLLIALTLMALGAITTASAAGQRGIHARELAGAPGAGAGEADLGKLPPSNPEQLALSNHLQQVGAVFYGAWWCPACTRQKELFGKEGASRLPYVECDRVASDREVCIAAQVKAFPTWELKGKQRLVGVQSLQELKSWSGYGR